MSAALLEPAIAGPVTVAQVDDPVARIDAAALLCDFVEWMRAAAGFELAAVQPAFADELAQLLALDRQPDLTLYLARVGAVAVGTVAVRAHPDGTAELKRMYVRPIARGLGVADRLIDAAVARAGAMGCGEVWLETKAGVMDRAISVYRRHGFQPQPDRPSTLPGVDGIVVMARPLQPRPRAVRPAPPAPAR